MRSAADFTAIGTGKLPGHLGIVITDVAPDAFRGEIVVSSAHAAPNGFLHAGTLVTLADTCCGYGCAAQLPEGATGFTTVELKANFMGTALNGVIECKATPLHLGRTTQVWDATVIHRESQKLMAVFRCTQMILYPK